MDTTAVLIALFSGGIGLYLVQEMRSWAKGRKSREGKALEARDAALEKLQATESLLERERKVRRMLEEHVHVLRQDLIQRGVPIDEIAPWPDYSTKN